MPIRAVAQDVVTLRSYEAKDIQMASEISFATLGIDPSQETEAVYHGPKGDLHFYDVRFCFVGQLIETGERSVRIGDEFKYWVRTAAPQGPTELGQTVAAVECATVIPWAFGEADDPELSVQMAKAEEIMHRYRNALRALANSER
jgi:hypothetical protein